MTVPEHSIYYLEFVTHEVQAACRLYAEAYGWHFQDKGPEWGTPSSLPFPMARSAASAPQRGDR